MDDGEKLVTEEGPNVNLLVEEFKQAGTLPNGFYDLAYNEESRRMIWAGQSPDGRKWDENMPEGQLALPWNGCSDTRVPVVDGVCNDEVSLLTVAFKRAELRAETVNPDNAALAAGLSAYLHWLVHTRLARALKLETELSVQYSREYGFCVAYVGWERELGKRRVCVTLEDLMEQGQTGGSPSPQPSPPGEGEATGGVQMSGQPDGSQGPMIGGAASPTSPMAGWLEQVQDAGREEEAAEGLRSLYRLYITQMLAGKGFFAEELEDETRLDLKLSTARRCVRELRTNGKTELPMPYVLKNGPLVRVLKPYQEFLAARGTMMLQEARACFWRRWFGEAELRAKAAEGWDADWIEEAVKTKGNMSSWAGALGATSLTGPSTKTVGNTTYLKVTEENNPLIEVVYGFVKKVDEDGVTGVWQTIFSPHFTNRNGSSPSPRPSPPGEGGREGGDFCAKHELLEDSLGRYPFMDYKRENIGRALVDSRSVAEVAGTWQTEEKKQRDMLFNRADWDTLPPVSVPKLGGVDYRLGPGAQVPMGRGSSIEAINFNAPPATLALELVKLLRLQRDEYFGAGNKEADPARQAAKQGKSGDDFYSFWGEVLGNVVALTVQYNPAEIVRVTGMPELGELDPAEVLEEYLMGMQFDLRELNPDFLVQKLEAINNQVLPGDAAGVIDRGALTTVQMQMVDPRLARQIVQDKGQASQKIYRDTELQVMKMALGNEAEYTENDATAPMKLQFLKTILASNPKYQQWLKEDQRFQALLQNYGKNLQMSVMQQENKQVGRIGVKPVGA